MPPISIFEEAYGKNAEKNKSSSIAEGNELNGTVEEIIYSREDTGFIIIAVEGEDGGLYSALGIMPDVNEGDYLKMEGRWENNAKYGRQFRVISYIRDLPADTASIERYLASGAIKGVRLKTAHRIVARFAEDTFDVIENHYEWLAEIPGISLKRAKEISDDFKSKSDMRSTIMFFRDYFGPDLTMRIYRRFGPEAVNAAKSNPYCLCGEVQGVGFEKADDMGRALGFPSDMPERIESGIRYILVSNAAQNGHICLPEDKLIATSVEMLKVSCDDCEKAIEHLLQTKKLVAESAGASRMIYEKTAYEDEKYIADKLRLLDKKCIKVDIDDADKFIDKEETARGIRYAALQRKAISDALLHGVMVLTGGPGTGKTTVVRALIDIFSGLDLEVALAAPTGRAAKRLSESTSHDAKTVHRLLEVEYSGEQSENAKFSSNDEHRLCFRRNEKDLLDEYVIIIDEASMMDSSLTASLLKAIKPGARLIIIGDSDQLPSVGAGNVLHDIIESGAFATVRLTEIFRQAQESLIVTNAHAINRGEMPIIDIKDKDFFYLQRITDAEIAATVTDLCVKRLPAAYGDEISSGIQIITPSRRGAGGTANLNLKLQQAINPKSDKKREHIHHEVTFREGDRVMQMRNNYEIEWVRGDKEGSGIFNGDIGVIKSINLSSQSMAISFDDRETDYSFQNLEDLELAYAITVHKSQGSEYPVVIIPMYGAPEMLLTRNLFYTAVTRAQKMVILVGRTDVIRTMVENKRQLLRYTGLCRRLSPAELP